MKKNKKQILSGLIGITLVLITQIFMRKADVITSSIPISGIFGLLIGICAVIVFIKSGDKLFGRKLNAIAGVLILVACTLSSIMSVLIKTFPEYADKHLTLMTFIVISVLISFVALIGFFIFVGVKYINKNK